MTHPSLSSVPSQMKPQMARSFAGGWGGGSPFFDPLFSSLSGSLSRSRSLSFLNLQSNPQLYRFHCWSCQGWWEPLVGPPTAKGLQMRPHKEQVPGP